MQRNPPFGQQPNGPHGPNQPPQYRGVPLYPPHPGPVPGMPQRQGTPQPRVTRSTPVPSIQIRQMSYRQPKNGFTVQVPALDFYPGELTYLGGESGSGKTTLMRMLALNLRPDSGDIVVLGRSVVRLSTHEQDDLRGGGLVYIPQDLYGLTSNTPIDNIRHLLVDFDGIAWDTAGEMALRALHAVRLPEECYSRSTSDLSGGQKARVAIAKLIASQRPICLADEILPALDQQSRMQILALFQYVVSQGYTVIIVAHQEDLKPYFHRIIEMRQGRVIGDKRNAQLTPIRLHS